MGLYLLDYGAGNVQSLANSLTKLGHKFTWIAHPSDFSKATSLIFPGVGAFETAIQRLSSRGLLEPLREYISSGRPYFGICIGLQVLFESSDESPSSKGLGIIPCHISRFSDSDKSVPHMGWNTADLLVPATNAADDIQEVAESSSYYYFVHSYCAKYDYERYPQALAEWTYSTTQYGNELFVSIIRKGNIFGTQFHPEKSGPAGLQLLDEWLSKFTADISKLPPSSRTEPVVVKPRPEHRFTKRIIACMDVRANDAGDLVVTKGDQYDVREKSASSSSAFPNGTPASTSVTVKSAGQVRNLGKPIDLARKYYQSGADEICLLNITSFRHSPLQDQPMLSVVQEASKHIFVPLTIGGGIKDTIDPDGVKRSALEVADVYFRAGADKVSIGSEAVYAVERLLAGEKGDEEEGAIESIARVYGSQAVVVSIDPKKVYVVNPETYSGPYKNELIFGTSGNEQDKAWWYQCTVSGGRQPRPLSVLQLAKGVEKLGAGELLINSIDRDGTGQGFDLGLINLIRKNVKIPVVASSGAGCVDHFVEVFRETDAEAALAAGIFHREQVGIGEVKEGLRSAVINVRV